MTTTPKDSADNNSLRQDALDYHRFPRPGKISIQPTKPLSQQRDLSLAYTPGVAFACKAIEADPGEARHLTIRSNLVGVITNGTAVLGLGNIGPLAAKPVMEGKAVLFRKFAGIDVFDIEINENDPDRLIDIIASLEPTFGGINLEDIKAPECFYIEARLRERMKIPVFHDDQHGTAIIVGAAITNGLKVVGKKLSEVKLVSSGAGAAALACLDLLVYLGLSIDNITVTDIAGVVYQGRKEEMDDNKARYAKVTSARTLGEVIAGADVFLGLSAGNVLKAEMVKGMAAKPLILALANPTPEIMPDEVRKVRDDAVICTGRSDFPNQVNNVLCFPFIFRGALDVGATTITREMEIAAVRAIADLAEAPQNEAVKQAYGGLDQPRFGAEYLIPKPFDPRLISKIAPAVARAAMESGVAATPITDWDTYITGLDQFVYHSGLSMRPIFQAAKKASAKRIVLAEGEDERVLRACQIIVDENLAKPILVGRPEVITKRMERFGLRLQADRDYVLINPDQDARYKDYWQTYHQLTERKGVTAQYAQIEMRRRSTLIGAMMVRKGDADGMICGTFGNHDLHLHYINQVIGLRPGVGEYAGMNLLMLPGREVFLVDTHVNMEPTAAQLADITLMAVEEMRRFGVSPKVALLSHSNFGTLNVPSARKMRETLALLRERAPSLEVEGEMHGDVALDAELRLQMFPRSELQGSANLLVFPSMEAANISYNLLKTAAGGGVTIGPILLGAAKPVHILTPSATIRRIVNMTALVVADANSREG